MGGLWGDTSKRAFDYVVYNFKFWYQNYRPTGDWAPGYAMELLDNGGGNCYRWAALYCMMIRAAGYSSNAIAGTHSGGRPHGWVEVYAGGKTYACDPEAQWEVPSRNWYWFTYDNAPLSYDV